MLRNFLSLARRACSLATLSVLVISSCAAQAPDTQAADTGKPTDRLPQLRELAEKFKIKIATANLEFPVKTIHGLIEGKEAESKSLKEYQKLLAAEVNRYPASLIRSSMLVRIVLCEELSFDGQIRNAIPDFEHNVLYLDVKRGDYNKQYQRKVIHHEFFHLIDFKDDGSVYADKAWADLNPSTFRYGAGGRSVQDDASTSLLTDRFPGFLNHYSTTGVEEDKAEMFANMMVEPEHVETRALEDPVIRSKLTAMKSLIQRFCPEANDEFWKQGIIK
jgi:hypothetical protein